MHPDRRRGQIGRGTWLDQVASRIIEREKSLGRSTTMLKVESGLGASGIPHVGSLGDAVRAHGIKLALGDMGYRSELIAYSDDMDGLRKVPSGLPEWLKRHISVPVTLVPDPFRCHDSYGQHMSSMLLDALDKLSIEYRFQSGAEAYRRGLLKEQIAMILENAEAIGRKIAEMLGQKKYEAVLPYFPICSRCGRVYLALAHSYLKDERKALYECRGAQIGRRLIEGCGNRGEADVTKGEGKLSWKGEFAARWSAQDIRFEAYGKDIADSVKVNDWISEGVLGFPPPYHVRYELFLDKSGRKISKSIGNVFTPQAWLRYGTPQSLMLLMFKRIAGTRHLSVEDVPSYMDEYDKLEDIYLGRVGIDNPAQMIKLRGLYEYVRHLRPDLGPGVHVPYRLLVQLASVAPSEDALGYVTRRLLSYGMVKEVEKDLTDKIRLASNWAEDFSSAAPVSISLSEGERGALRELADFIRHEEDHERIQNEIFEVARRHGIAPQRFFRAIYQILLGADKGPRLGRYIADIGVGRAASLILEQARS